MIQNLGAEGTPTQPQYTTLELEQPKKDSESRSKMQGHTTTPETETPMSSNNDVPMADADASNPTTRGELLVWPWTGIVATTTTTITTAADDGDGHASTTLLASLAQHHFAGVPTTTLHEEDAAEPEPNKPKPKPKPNGRCHHFFLLLHFGKSWAGLRDAMSLGFHFAGAGRSEWRRQRGGGSTAGDRVFGWAAAAEDLKESGGGAVGRFLRESGAEARSVEDLQKDEARHADALGAVRDEYEKREKVLDAERKEMLRLLRKVEQQNTWLSAELKELQAIDESFLPELSHGVDDEENEKLRAELDALKGEIQLTVDRIQELKERRTELHCSKVDKINSLEMEERQTKTRDHVQMLQEKHKEEMEAINTTVVQLEKQLEQKEAKVSATCLLDMKLKTGENLTEEARQHLYKLMTIWKECHEQERERYQNAHIDLTKRDRMSKDELQETRQELIKCLESVMIGGCTVIGIKTMGLLDEKTFYHACKRKYRDDDPEGKASRLVSIWQEELKNPYWNPFTTILVNGEEKDIVDENDPKLRQLWTEYGDDTCNAVKNALRELHEYKPEGRQAVNELWNFREGRKATVAEVVNYIFEQLKMRNQFPVHTQVNTL